MNMTAAATLYGAMIRGIAGASAGRDGSAATYWEGRVALDSDVAQLRRGDLDALSALLARYQNRLYRYLLRMVRQPAEAEDLFQQTWLRVAEKIRSYDQNLDAIAKILGAPLSTVKTRLRRGLEHLRGKLESRFPGENWQ